MPRLSSFKGFKFTTYLLFVPQIDISYKKPTLNLNLYDTTGDEDIFINQVLVDTGIAAFVENLEEQTGEIF